MKIPGNEAKQWKIWWLWAVPVAWIASAMVLGAEHARIEGFNRSADLLDLARLGVYWLWCRPAWRVTSIAPPVWRLTARGALAGGFALNFLV
jgi:hypothetical protein